MDPNDQKKTACYDIDVEVEDPLKSQMSSFLLSTANQQEIASLDNKVRPLASAVMQCNAIYLKMEYIIYDILPNANILFSCYFSGQRHDLPL